MLGIIIFIGVCFLIYKALTKNQTENNAVANSILQESREIQLTEHILNNINTTLKNSLDLKRLDEDEKGMVLFFALEKLKILTKDASFTLSKNFQVPHYRVNEIIDNTFDRFMKPYN